MDDFPGMVLVVSHDRGLLDRVDHVGELRDGAVTWYGGNLTAYEEALAAEQAAAERDLRDAESRLRKQRRELADAHVKLARRKRYGQKMWDTKREPKVVMGERKRQAQVSAGKHRLVHEDRVDRARDQRDRVSVHQLTTALEAYRGALVVVSHDLAFLRSVGITRWIAIDPDLRGLRDNDPSPTE